MRGLFFCVVLPYHDPFDEPLHFAYASFLAVKGRPPLATEDSCPRELQRPIGTLPRSVWTTSDTIAWSAFIKLPATERDRRRQQAFDTPLEERSTFFIPNYESQQPPLYYALAALILKPAWHAPLNWRLALLRVLSAILVAATVPIVYQFFRRLLPQREALAATFGWTTFPAIGIFVGRMTNDALELLLAAVLMVFWVDIRRGRLSRKGAAGLALTLAAACWTKLYGIVFLPVAPLAAMLAPKTRRRSAFTRAACSSVAAGIALIPWLVRQYRDTGTWSGLTEAKLARALGIGERAVLSAVPAALNRVTLGCFGRSFLWPGTWSRIAPMGAPAWTWIVLAAGLALFWCAGIGSRGTGPSRRRDLVPAGAAVALFLVAQLHHCAQFYAVALRQKSWPLGGSEGWYLLVLTPAVLALGWLVFERPRAWVLGVASLCFITGEIVLTFSLLPGTYAGLISPSGDRIGMMLRTPRAIFGVYHRVGLLDVPAGAIAIVALAWFAALALGAWQIARLPSRPWPFGSRCGDRR